MQRLTYEMNHLCHHFCLFFESSIIVGTIQECFLFYFGFLGSRGSSPAGDDDGGGGGRHPPQVVVLSHLGHLALLRQSAEPSPPSSRRASSASSASPLANLLLQVTPSHSKINHKGEAKPQAKNFENFPKILLEFPNHVLNVVFTLDIYFLSKT